MTRWWAAFGSAGAFVALAVAVHLGLLDTADSVVRAWARPDDVWGSAQVRADLLVEGLRPAVAWGLLAAFTAAYCVRRRSLRPATFVGCVGLATVALTIAAKTAVGRPDAGGSLGNNGGSFPSGHVITLMVTLGLAVLVSRPRRGHWVWLIAALGGGLMGVALLLQAVHWLTDLVGGSLLAIVVLCFATASRWSHWLHDKSQNDQRSAIPAVSSPSSLAPVGVPSAPTGKLEKATGFFCAHRLLRSSPGKLL
jgi:membrane-associated phospholipid phosphatase